MIFPGTRGLLMDGEPGAGGGGTPPVLTIESVSKLVNDGINGAIAKLKTESKADLTAALKPFEGLGAQLTQLTENITALQTVEPAGGKGKVKDGDLPPEVNAELAKLRKSQETLQKQLDTTENARKESDAKAKASDKASQVKSALSEFNFASPEAAEDAFTLLNSKIEWDDDGKLVCEGLPMADFVKAYIPEKKAHFLAPTGKGGAGANNTRQGANGGFQMEAIKPGINKEDSQRAASAIVAALGS